MNLLSQKQHLMAYKDNGCFWGLTPNSYVKCLPKILSPPAQVLDLGAGEGRNSIFLAKLGYSVISIDICNIAIKKLREIAIKNELYIETELSDIVKYKFRRPYDIIISNATFQLIDRNEIPKVIKRMQQNTTIGGINLLTVFSDKDPAKNTSPNKVFFNKEQLKTFYSEWKLIILEHYIRKETHGRPHKHNFLALIARKIR